MGTSILLLEWSHGVEYICLQSKGVEMMPKIFAMVFSPFIFWRDVPTGRNSSQLGHYSYFFIVHYLFFEMLRLFFVFVLNSK